MKVKLSIFNRIAMLALILVQFILYAYSTALLIHYVAYPFAFFDGMPSLITTNSNHQPLTNLLLYCLFWVQHILMARKHFKINMLKYYAKYFLFERYIYNIASAIVLVLILSQAQPSQEVVFEMPSFICVPLVVYGLILVNLAIIQLGYRIAMPYSISQIFLQKTIACPRYQEISNEQLSSDGIYFYSRNPMQAGSLLLILFSHPILTIDRMIFMLIMVTGILIGVRMEEARMLKGFKQYAQYMKSCPYRFFPYIC